MNVNYVTEKIMNVNRRKPDGKRRHNVSKKGILEISYRVFTIKMCSYYRDKTYFKIYILNLEKI
jgi:hypothetical protein